MGLHSAANVQYIRPEIIGLVLGSLLLACLNKEFHPRGGSAPLTRFVLGFFVMIGCLVFLGCPFRMILRLAGGDLNALAGLAGFVCGILAGIFFLQRGYSLKRTYRLPAAEGALFPCIQAALLLLLAAAPAFIHFTEAGGGPGALHAPLLISLAAGLIVGVLAQRTRLCMVGGIRDMILFRESRLLAGFAAVFAAALAANLVLGLLTGVFLAGFGCVLLGGCPLRQLILAGEGNTDSAIAVLGLLIGAAFAHNFGLASSTDGPTAAGKIAVIIGIAAVACIGGLNSRNTQ